MEVSGMAEEFRFKQKKNEVVLAVKRENADGSIDQKDLSFDCSPTNYAYVARVMAAGISLKKKMREMKDKETKGDIEQASSLIIETINAEKETFEAMAPGKWGEFFEFLGSDIENMSELIGVMVETITAKGSSAKKESIKTQAPDGAAELV